MKKAAALKPIISFSLLLYQAEVQADFDIIAPLDFGEMVITDNSTVSSIKITADGGYYPSGKIYILKAGSPAEISFYNYPVNSYLYFEVSIAEQEITAPAPGSAKFQLEAATADKYIITDDNGNALLKIGATLKTSGTGERYESSSYQGYFNLSVNYY